MVQERTTRPVIMGRGIGLKGSWGSRRFLRAPWHRSGGLAQVPQFKRTDSDEQVICAQIFGHLWIAAELFGPAPDRSCILIIATKVDGFARIKQRIIQCIAA